MGSSHSAPRRAGSLRRLRSSRRMNSNNNSNANANNRPNGNANTTNGRNALSSSSSSIPPTSNSSSSGGGGKVDSGGGGGHHQILIEDSDPSGSGSSSYSSTLDVTGNGVAAPSLPSLQEETNDDDFRTHSSSTTTTSVPSTLTDRRKKKIDRHSTDSGNDGSSSSTDNENANSNEQNNGEARPRSTEERTLERIRRQQQDRQQGVTDSAGSPSTVPSSTTSATTTTTTTTTFDNNNRRRGDHQYGGGGGGGLSVIPSSRSLSVDDDLCVGDTVEVPLAGESTVRQDTSSSSQQQQREPSSSSSTSWGPPIYTPVLLMGDPESPNYAYGVAASSFSEPSSTGEYQDGSFYYYGGSGNGGGGGCVMDGQMSPQAASTMMMTMTMGIATSPVPDFFPQGSRHYEWMGRSLETLLLGYGSVVPVLCLPEDEDGANEEDMAYLWGAATRRRSTVSTLGSSNDYYGQRRSSLETLGHGVGRRGSLAGSLSGGNSSGSRMHGGTMANYYSRRRDSAGRRGSNNSGSASGSGRSNRRGSNRRGSASHGPSYRQRRASLSRSGSGDSDGGGRMGSILTKGGPNVALSLLARESTGKLTTRNGIPASKRLRAMSPALYNVLDSPAGGMCSEVTFLSEVIDSGDWAETQDVISRLSPRLIGDPSQSMIGPNGQRRVPFSDPNLPPNTPLYYAGGGRLGLERDAFVLAGGVGILIRVFREPSFVGSEMARSYDARDLSEELVVHRLAQCWNEVLSCLRELVYSMPSLVENEVIFGDGDFVPFLFTLLSQDSCFDGAVALIEEILSLQSHSPQQMQSQDEDDPIDHRLPGRTSNIPAPKSFFLGNVPDLFSLWSSFNCRQLAHFCRILALLVFEPEDRQLLERPSVLKSVELLQLRRNRAARAGRDSTVDMNQSILLGDDVLLERLLQLLSVMNFSPSLRHSSSYHVMAYFPYIADTLIMLGLHEFDNWSEISQVDRLARRLLVAGNENGPTEHTQLRDLGSISDMLENLSTSLSSEGEHTNRNLLMIAVMSAAQAAGVDVGQPRQNRSNRGDRSQGDSQNQESGASGPPAVGSLGAAGSLFTDGMLLRLLQSLQNSEDDGGQNEGSGGRGAIADHPAGSSRSRIYTPEDAANVMQFNALILAPYQVEVLFVLCTLLGGRRKIDAQEKLIQKGVVSVLDDLFERLPWDSLSPMRQTIQHQSPNGRGNGNDDPNEQPHGVHGPGCECTPESALCVQYLRLLHNFCDRDCDNYSGRRLLLSQPEREVIFDNSVDNAIDISRLTPGLLSKVITAFIGESDESPYRFWLESCIEAYLRGASQGEQIFVAQTGLMQSLIRDITSQRLHCAGSLQTSFDLLGEVCKGNVYVLRLLVKDLDENTFRKLMSVAAANLVDSNVFIRSLLLGLERVSAANDLVPAHLAGDVFEAIRAPTWRSANGTASRSYVTHSWWDTCMVKMGNEASGPAETPDAERQNDALRPSDWFPTRDTLMAHDITPPESMQATSNILHSGVGHSGWIFTPEGGTLSPAARLPNTVERLSWFMEVNRARLLRDLLEVVNLRNINHENICCLNTAVVVAIFAHRRQQLHKLLQDLRRMSDEENDQRRAVSAAVPGEENVVDQAFAQAMKSMDLYREVPLAAPYARRASLGSQNCNGPGVSFIAGRDLFRNFREVLWFWTEYYTHRGRDRLSLEFSSHLRFSEWMEVVALLTADNGTPTSLVPSPLPLPRTPYLQRAT